MMVWVMSLHTIFGTRMRCGGRDVPKFFGTFSQTVFFVYLEMGSYPCPNFWHNFSPTVSLVYFFTNANALHSELPFRLIIYVLLPSSNIFANLPFLLTFNEKMHFFLWKPSLMSGTIIIQLSSLGSIDLCVSCFIDLSLSYFEGLLEERLHCFSTDNILMAASNIMIVRVWSIVGIIFCFLLKYLHKCLTTNLMWMLYLLRQTVQKTGFPKSLQ